MLKKIESVKKVLDDRFLSADMMCANSIPDDMYYRAIGNKTIEELARKFKQTMFLNNRFRHDFISRLKEIEHDKKIGDVWRTGTFAVYIGFAFHLKDTALNTMVVSLGYDLTTFVTAKDLIFFFGDKVGIHTSHEITKKVQSELENLRDLINKGLPLKITPETERLVGLLADRIRKETTLENPIFGELPNNQGEQSP